MTNLDVIKLYAENSPDLLAEFLEDIYCIGFCDGSRSTCTKIEDTIPELNEEWLNSECDRDLFREMDIISHCYKRQLDQLESEYLNTCGGESFDVIDKI